MDPPERPIVFEILSWNVAYVEPGLSLPSRRRPVTIPAGMSLRRFPWLSSYPVPVRGLFRHYYAESFRRLSYEREDSK